MNSINSSKSPDDPEPLIYFVSGMWCGTCSRAVEAGVRSLHGVRSAEINFLTKLMTVTPEDIHNSESVSFTIIDKVRSLGYSAIEQERSWLGNYRALLTRDRERSFSKAQLFLTLFFSMWTSMFALARYSGGFADAPAEGYFLAVLTMVSGTAAVILGITPYARAALRAVQSRTLTFDLIISIGAVSAISLSLLALYRGESEVYVDSAAMIISVLLLTKWFEAFLAESLVNRLTYQLSSTNKTFEIFKNGSWRSVDETQVNEDDLIRYQQGQIITLDGIVTGKRATVSEEFLSGESSTRDLDRGDVVNAGMRLITPLELRVTKTLGNRLIDRWAKSSLLRMDKPCDDFQLLSFLEKYLVSLSLIGASALAFLSYLETGVPLLAAQQFFVGILIFCPCLLVSVLPMAQLLSSISLRTQGVVLASATALSRLARTKRFFFDKTGTLLLVRTEWECFDERIELVEEILAMAKSVSAHPILRGLTLSNPPSRVIYQHEEHPGEGIAISSHLGAILIGSPTFLERMGVSIPTKLHESRSLIALNNELLGRLRTRPEHLTRTVTMLRALVNEYPLARVHVLSGDPDATQGELVKNLFGAQFDYQGGLSPQEKADIVMQFDDSVFIGDGLNDTPALNSADVSVRVGPQGRRMGEVDIYIAGHDLGRFKMTLDYAKRFRAIIRETIAISFVYNITAFILAIYSFFNPLTAALAMLFSLMLMISSIYRLTYIKYPQVRSDEKPLELFQLEPRHACS